MLGNGGNSENELNSYQWFSGGGSRFLIFHLEADIPDEAIAWVEGVLERHPGTPAIVSTHIYMSDETKSRSQEEYYRKDVGNSGEAVWNKLIRKKFTDFYGALRPLAQRRRPNGIKSRPIMRASLLSRSWLTTSPGRTAATAGYGSSPSCPKRIRYNSARTLPRWINTKPMRTVSSPCRLDFAERFQPS